MKSKYISIVLTLALMICSLCGCGGPGAKSNHFVVEYVAQAGVLSPSIIMVGQYKGETVKLAIDSFKDCTLSSMEFIDGDQVSFSGTEEGYLKIDGGVLITLTDPESVSHTLEIKEDSSFELEELTGGWRLLLPV